MASFFLTLAVVATLGSCVDDDNEESYTYYADTAVSSFTLGTLNRYLHTTAESGEDSLYMTQFAGSDYRMSIDQLGGRIYNNDSLPYGTDVSHVIASITAYNNGTIMLKAIGSDSLYYYNYSDSIDFSSPRTMRVISQDGSRYADYTVTLSVRQRAAGTTAWQRTATSDGIAALENTVALAAGGRVYVFGDENGGKVGFYTSEADGATWTRIETGLSRRATIISRDSTLFALDNGNTYTSEDGQTWTATGSDSSLLKLVAASSKHIYALTTANGLAPNGIASSADNGRTWTNEELDDDALLLPDYQGGYSCVPLSTNDSIDRVMIVGYISSTNDVVARAWTKLDDYSANPVASKWNFVNDAGDASFQLKELPTLAVATYEGYPVAIGCLGATVSKLLRTRDGGITWKDSGIELPAALTADDGKLAMTADSEGTLWIVASGDVWRN